MKKLVIILLVLIIFINFVSAGLLGDFWSRITGNVVEEDEELGKECQERGGVPQGSPHPDKDKNCDVYTRCIYMGSEEIKIVSRDECYRYVDD